MLSHLTPDPGNQVWRSMISSDVTSPHSANICDGKIYFNLIAVNVCIQHFISHRTNWTCDIYFFGENLQLEYKNSGYSVVAMALNELDFFLENRTFPEQDICCWCDGDNNLKMSTSLSADVWWTNLSDGEMTTACNHHHPTTPAQLHLSLDNDATHRQLSIIIHNEWMNEWRCY